MATVRHDTTLGVATRRASMALVLGVSRYRPATRSTRPTTRPAISHNTAGLDHDMVGEGATTRSSGLQDTAPSARCAHGLGSMRT